MTTVTLEPAMVNCYFSRTGLAYRYFGTCNLQLQFGVDRQLRFGNDVYVGPCRSLFFGSLGSRSLLFLVCFLGSLPLLGGRVPLDLRSRERVAGCVI
jgi:hypothetical protein